MMCLWSEVMDKSTYEEVKRILLLLVVISATGIVLQMSMVHDKYDRQGVTSFKQIMHGLRELNGVHKPARQITDASDSGPSAIVTTLTNLSRYSNETLDHIQLKNLSLSFMEWVHLMETRQQIRTDRMNYFCSRANLSKYTVDEMLVRKGLRATFYSNDNYKITFSVVKKAASNNFENLFKELGGLVRLYMLPEDMCKERLQTYMRALFVRHPLSRFLSAYKDKFVYHHIEHFTNIGRVIINKFRRNVTRQERLRAAKKAEDVRFEEFLEYIASDHKFRKNSHWNKYLAHNRVCEFRYDFIGKIETFHDDIRYMLYKAGVKDFSKLNIPKAYLSYHASERGMLRSYYEKIPIVLLQRLHNIYRMDFNIFGYSMEILGDDIWHIT